MEKVSSPSSWSEVALVNLITKMQALPGRDELVNQVLFGSRSGTFRYSLQILQSYILLQKLNIEFFHIVSTCVHFSTCM